MHASTCVGLLLLVLCFASALCKTKDDDSPHPVTCYTGIAQLSGQQLAVINATSAVVGGFHTNKRTVHAATLTGTNLVVLSHYANTASDSDLTLERFAMDGGALIDSVALSRSSAEPRPSQICATNYAAVLLEANATLTLYDLVAGRHLATPNAPATLLRAIACSSTRLFAAVAGGTVLELDPTDALALRRVGALPGITAMYVVDAPPLLLHMQIGLPVTTEAVMDVDSHSLTAMSDTLTQPVLADSIAAAAECRVPLVDVVHSQLSQELTGVRDPACVPLSAVAQPLTVLSDGIFWQGSPVATPLGGAALNNGNLGTLMAAASCETNSLLLLDTDGALVLYDNYNGAIQRLPSLPGPPVRVLVLGCGVSVWYTANNDLMARMDAATGGDFLLPPIGGLLSAAFVRLAADGITVQVCLQLARQLHCMDPTQPDTTLEVIVLPPESEAPGGLLSVAHGSDIYGLSVDAKTGVKLWRADGVSFSAWCSLDLKHAGLPLPDTAVLRPLSDAVLLWTQSLVVELDWANCSVVAAEPVALPLVAAANAAAGDDVALVLGQAASEQECLFMAHATHGHHSSGVAVTLPLILCGLLCCACWLIILLAATPTIRKRYNERFKHRHHGWNTRSSSIDTEGADRLITESADHQQQQQHWWASPAAQSAVHMCCCCVPALKNRILSWQASHMRVYVPSSEILYTTSNGTEMTPVKHAVPPGGNPTSAASAAAAVFESVSSSSPISATTPTTDSGSLSPPTTNNTSLLADDAHYTLRLQ